MTSRGTALALIGAQWGSEGKGVIAGHLARKCDAAVRVGGPNAGHSLYHDGALYKMRSVPCAWVNPDAGLYIGAGAVVNPELLESELAGLPGERTLHIDPVAVLVSHEHEAAEASINASIGSTAEGVGQARISRIRRDGSAALAGDREWSSNIRVVDVAEELDLVIRHGGTVMLEGTQGSGLSLIHGTQYPYATSTDTNAATLAGDSGIAPSDVGHVQLVARTFPIRVAGTSGPMGEELDWSYFIDRGLVAAPEQTTVTKKTRRISQWYWPVVDRAVRLNRPCGIWLTFGDYIDPSIVGSPSVRDSAPVMGFVQMIEDMYDIPVLGVGTGPVVGLFGVADWQIARLRGACTHGVTW